MLRAQQVAYQLAFAVQGPFLIAIVGAAWTLRRPGMRAFALVYSFLSLATISSALSVTTLTRGGSPLLHDLTLALTMFALAASWATNRQAVGVLSGNREASAPNILLVLLAGGVSTAIALAVPTFPFEKGIGVFFKATSPRPLILMFALSASVDAWRASKHTEKSRLALQLIAVSWAVLVARQAFGLFASAMASMGDPSLNGAVSFVQTATTVLNGVAILLALMLEERSAMAAQAELVRATELRLSRAQRMESLGQMAGGIAHDFANVLMIIDAEVAGARETTEPAEVREHLQHARAAVERATDLTRQLSLFARQRAPSVSIFAVSERIHSIEPMLRRLVGADIELSIDTSDAQSARVEMDPSQFDQVMLNLLVNARDAMPDGGTVKVTTRHRQWALLTEEQQSVVPAGPIITIEVADDGTGIAADVIDRIFEPFYSTKGDRGTGLGLATVSTVVRLARGAVEVRSEPAKGTTFAVHLPAMASP